MTKELIRDLERARNKLALGWMQNRCCDGASVMVSQRLCAVGALQYAIHVRSGTPAHMANRAWTESQEEWYERLCHVLISQIPGATVPYLRGNTETTVPMTVAKWNDKPERTVGEVLDLFAAAIAHLRCVDAAERGWTIETDAGTIASPEAVPRTIPALLPDTIPESAAERVPLPA